MLSILQDPMFNTPDWVALDPLTLQPLTGSGAFVPSPLGVGPDMSAAAPPQPTEQQVASMDPGTVGLIGPGSVGISSGPSLSMGGLLDGGLFDGLGSALAQGAGALIGGATLGPPGAIAGSFLGGKVFDAAPPIPSIGGNGGLFDINNYFATAPGQYTDTSGGDIGASVAPQVMTVTTPGGSGYATGVDAQGNPTGIEGWSDESFSYFSDPDYGGAYDWSR